MTIRGHSSRIPVVLSLAAVFGAGEAGIAATAAAIPAIQSDAQKAIAAQWAGANWKTCLLALDIATRLAGSRSAGMKVMESGRDPAWPPKDPYDLPAEYADTFWDWVAGSVQHSDDVSDQNKVKNAYSFSQAVVDQYYKDNNRALMDKVDANFQDKNARRAMYELLAYKASGGSPDLEPLRLCYAANTSPPRGADGRNKPQNCRQDLADYVHGKFYSKGK